ncbi:MAG: AzlC family ABC transporter permease [Parvibaculaceae bacterium]
MTSKTIDNWQEFREGALDIAPVVLACIPIGLLFGTLAAAKGISVLEAGLMSALVFAGASQFVAVDMWREPAPWAMLTLTVLIVNVRHILMGASLARHLRLFAPATRPLALFVMADEVWAFAERRALRQPLTPAYYWGMGACLYAQWTLGTVLGASLGRTLGNPADYGLDFAFAAMFICIAMGFWRGPRTAAVLATSAIVAALTSTLVPGAWYIAIGGLAGVAVAAFLGEEPEKAPA